MPRPKGSPNKPSLAKAKDKQKVLEGLALSRGIIGPVCKQLNIPRASINKWINEDSAFAEKFYEIREASLDKIETELYKQVDKGNPQVLIFMARSLLSQRGFKYSDTEITNNQIENKNITIVVQDNETKQLLDNLMNTIDITNVNQKLLGDE